MLSNKLAVLFAKADSKMDAAAKKKKAAKADVALLAKFNGKFPPSLVRVMAGEATAPNTGFHKVALQIAITANALGVPEEQVLAACAGVIEKHQSDGTRYATPAKRRAELQRLLHYTSGNPCYEYRKDAVRALLPMGTPTPDLDGLTAETSGEITAQGEDGNSEGLLGGVFVTERGVFKRVEQGAIKISDISFKDVCLLYDAQTAGRWAQRADSNRAARGNQASQQHGVKGHISASPPARARCPRM